MYNDQQCLPVKISYSSLCIRLRKHKKRSTFEMKSLHSRNSYVSHSNLIHGSTLVPRFPALGTRLMQSSTFELVPVIYDDGGPYIVLWCIFLRRPITLARSGIFLEWRVARHTCRSCKDGCRDLSSSFKNGTAILITILLF